MNTDYSYDGLNRLTLRSVKVSDTLNLNNAYTYMTTSRNESGKTYATTRLATETIVGVPYGYTYSNMGDIMSITRSGDAYKSYTYDALGEMRSETQHTLNRKSSYTYDSLGNILTKTTVNTNTNANISSVTYGYGNDSDAGWNKLLTSLTFTDYTNSSNNRTETIDYDEIGNPLSYRGATMSWFGRQLRTYSKDGISANFMYDADGLRSAKGVNGVKTTYQYVGDKLYYEKIGNDKTLYYFYDSYGNLANIYYTCGTSSAIYHVATNSQGDVIALYNFAGKKVGAYDYDAWGNTRVFVVTQDSDGNNIHTQIDPETQYLNHIVNVNPIRYRGYYYDSDLDLYYLQSRYYDAEIGRFINADGTLNGNGDIIGFNMYSYCSNNPVMFSDESGCGFWEDLKNYVTEKINNLKYKINRLFKEPLPYETVTDAAIASGTDLNERTQVTNLEYGQGITYDADTNSYGLTTTVTGEHASVDFSSILSDPSVVALVHSHPNCDGHIANEFSDTLNDGDMVYGDWVVANSNKKNIYLAAPNGNLYLMEWDVGEYNQSLVSSGLPIDDTPVECVF